MIRFKNADDCNCRPRRALIPGHCCPPPGVPLGELSIFSDDFTRPLIAGLPPGWTPIIFGAGGTVTKSNHTTVNLKSNPNGLIGLQAEGPLINPTTDDFCICYRARQVSPQPVVVNAGTILGLADISVLPMRSVVLRTDQGGGVFWLLQWQDNGPTTSFLTPFPIDGAEHLFKICRNVGGQVVVTEDDALTASFPIDGNFPSFPLAPSFAALGAFGPPDINGDLRVGSVCAEWRPA